MKAPISLALLAILGFARFPAGAAERACRPSLSNFYHCPDTSPAATKTTTKATKTTSSSSRACRPSLSNLWTCPGAPQSSRKSAGGTSSDNQGSAPSKKLQRPSGDVDPACRAGTSVRVKDKLVQTSTPPKHWHGHIAPPRRSSGQIPNRMSTTSGELTITATHKPALICVRKTRSPKGCARRKMRSTRKLILSLFSLKIAMLDRLVEVQQGSTSIGGTVMRIILALAL